MTRVFLLILIYTREEGSEQSVFFCVRGGGRSLLPGRLNYVSSNSCVVYPPGNDSLVKTEREFYQSINFCGSVGIEDPGSGSGASVIRGTEGGGKEGGREGGREVKKRGKKKRKSFE